MKKGTIIKLGIFFIVILIVYSIFMSYSSKKPLILYGNVDIRNVDLAFRVSGRLIMLNVDEGDTVKHGELIARLDPVPYQLDVDAAKAAVLQQKAVFDYAKIVYEREKRLRGTGASSQDTYENALSAFNKTIANIKKLEAELSLAQLHLQDTYLYAPSAGVVLTRVVEPGSMLPANATVITVSLIDPVWVRAYISETELAKAKPGTLVNIYSDSITNKSFQGKIGFVSPVAEFTPKTVETTQLRTDLVYRLRIIVHDLQHELRQGMPVTIKFIGQS